MLKVLQDETLYAHNVTADEFKPTMHTKIVVECTACHEIFSREYAYLMLPHDCLDAEPRPSNVEVPRVEVVIKDAAAKTPYRARATDAGFDVTSVIDVTISPQQVVDINTGLVMVAPRGIYFTVEGRSSMYRSGVVPFRGILDSGFCGDLVVTLMNVGSADYHISKGDRVAQIIPHRLIPIDIVEMDVISTSYNIRGTNGFGSSGK